MMSKQAKIRNAKLQLQFTNPAPMISLFYFHYLSIECYIHDTSLNGGVIKSSVTSDANQVESPRGKLPNLSQNYIVYIYYKPELVLVYELLAS